MLLANRKFTRELPTKEAKSLYIFCEGLKREYEYFNFFKEKDSRINVIIYQLSHDEDNSPLGLLAIAEKNIIQTKRSSEPKFDFQKNDEVWLVLDTDPDKQQSRKEQIKILRNKCQEYIGWDIAESNPCFEVWLYYHKHSKFEDIPDKNICKSYNGGFDSRRHPIFIEEAVENSKNNFHVDLNSNLSPGSTELHRLANSILGIMKEKIRRIKSQVKI